jgi:soluble lytic murein transglycosylase-like protein
MPVQRTLLFVWNERSRILTLSLPVLACALIVVGVSGLPHGASFAVVAQQDAGATAAASSVAPALPSDTASLHEFAQTYDTAAAIDSATPSEAVYPVETATPRQTASLPAPESHEPVASAAETALVSAQPREQHRDTGHAKLATPRLIAAAGSGAAPRRQLSQEQANVARFISGKYRVAVDASGEFVYYAFRNAREMKLDPFLILAVMSVESSFNPLAQSGKGAQGLMQVLTRVHADRFVPFGGVTAAFDPVANIRVGSLILKEYLDREGSVEGALKSYVGAALLAHDNGYAAKVLSERERIAAAAAGRAASGGAWTPTPASGSDVTGLDRDRLADPADRAPSSL